ncbi:MAG TPA: molybdopterin-guanine dinucleotide biosynthesis protein B [Thermoanaerobaculia bacterium]|jgi:molybdopterin-guanine dinucleotide biosynthesis protein B
MRVVAITGFSGSGKTTLILRVIERSVAAGQRVGCIKHTHHPLNEEDRGDTGRMRKAGAERVILANSGQAVIFEAAGTRRVTYGEPRELLAHFAATDLVLIEGWKGYDGWPNYSVDEARELFGC